MATTCCHGNHHMLYRQVFVWELSPNQPIRRYLVRFVTFCVVYMLIARRWASWLAKFWEQIVKKLVSMTSTIDQHFSVEML